METAINLKGRYSYADYSSWPDDERWELIDGYPYNMSPAPKRKHQVVVLELARKFADYFDKSPCQVFIAPFDVRLSEDYSDDHLIETIVQPDISVFCDKNKLDDQGAKGVPDLVVEVLYPSTAAKDLKTKLLLYQKYGVKEYWIVDPDKETVEVIVLDQGGKYNPGIVTGRANTVKSVLFEGLRFKLEGVFEKAEG